MTEKKEWRSAQWRKPTGYEFWLWTIIVINAVAVTLHLAAIVIGAATTVTYGFLLLNAFCGCLFSAELWSMHREKSHKHSA